MAYTKTSNKTQDKDVKYLSKDYNNFKDKLIELAQVYYPNTFNDFSEGSPGMMFIEMAAYVGDILSFYTDTQLQESFLSLAQDRENLYRLAYTLGYTPKMTTAATTNLEVYHLLPSKVSNNIYTPDWRYALKVEKGSTFKSTEGPTFRSEEKVNFNHSSSFDPTEVNIYQLDNSDNPQYYLLKKKVRAISAEPESKTFTVGSAEKYLTLTLSDINIIGIESITDSEGQEWHEVPYLAQDTIFEEVENMGANDPDLHGFNQQTPYLLKLRKVPRRFATRFTQNDTIELQFGAGISDKADETIIPNPDNIGLGIKD